MPDAPSKARSALQVSGVAAARSVPGAVQAAPSGCGAPTHRHAHRAAHQPRPLRQRRDVIVAPVRPVPASFAARLFGTAAALLAAAGATGFPQALAADLPGVPPAASAAPPPVGEPRWTFAMSAYLWAAGLDGRMRTLPPLPVMDVSIGFDQVVKNLDGGIMAAGEAQYGRTLIFGDLLASKLSPSKVFTPRGFPAEVKVQSGTTMALVAVGYRLVDDPGYSIDVFAGVRGVSVSNTLKVLAGPVAPRLSESEQWADAVGGTRVKVKITDALSASVIAFAGGGGSRYEWDVFGGLNYAFNDRWSAFAGYRALRVDYRKGSFVFDALQHGPLLGVTSRF